MLPLNLDELRDRWAKGERFDLYLFYGHKPPETGVDASCLSQWFVRGFDVDGIHYRTAEHWMMAEKGRLFADDEMVQQIVASETPREAKALGRKVRNFDPDIWNQHKFDIVCRGNHAKFSQHHDLRKFLTEITSGNAMPVSSAKNENTDQKESSPVLVAESRAAYSVNDESDPQLPIFVEAAGRDRIWGIGLGQNNPKASNPLTWRGQNLLGFALTKVRDELR